MQIIFLLLAFFALWLAALTFIVIFILRFFRKLAPGVTGKNLIELLGQTIEAEKRNAKAISELEKLIVSLEVQGRDHLQKVGFLRFNPFQELGGDHSFSAALLDGKDSGIVVTGLHSRERTRVYVKEIKKGKSVVELSREEKSALKEAQKV